VRLLTRLLAKQGLKIEVNARVTGLKNQEAHAPSVGSSSGMGDLPAVSSSVALAKEEASGEGWVLPMLPGARPRARCPCHDCARQTPLSIGRCSAVGSRCFLVVSMSFQGHRGAEHENPDSGG
jgi:hypothetical protein